MRTTATRTVIFLALATSGLLLGCKSRPVEAQTHKAAPAPTSRNFAGLWEGSDKSGAVYTVRFVGAEWECHVEKGGARLPHYRGTYTFAGSNLDLRIAEEADPMTNEWVPERGNFPKNISGKLAGGRLRIPALAEAELTRKN